MVGEAGSRAGSGEGEGDAISLACHLNVLVAGLDDAELLPALAALAEHGCTAGVLPPVHPARADAGGLRARFD
ncbi:MAG: hypothetical protein ACTH31_16210, partial [Pseudoclavibacter sp.]